MKKNIVILFAGLALFLCSCNTRQENIALAEVRALAKEAYIYGFPMVDNYRISYAYFVDSTNSEYKTSWNKIRNFSRLYTPEDKAVQTPNSDTPYSFLCMDLRAEPQVITVPHNEENRYFSIQLVDAYTFNFDYIGSRTTGNEGGSFLIAGPRWKGENPEGVKKVIRSETEFVIGIFRTQLFGPEDIGSLRKVQEGYKIQPLSEFLGEAEAKKLVAIDFIKPLSPDHQKTSLEFFNILNFTLQFCPINPSEKELMNRFEKIGVGTGKKLDVGSLSPEIKEAYELGMADAWAEFANLKKEVVDGKVVSGDLFGTREFLKNNYLYRMAGAITGIYGNSIEEAMYPAYFVDSEGEELDGNSNYTLHFEANQLPPVNAFWSLTMYELPSQLLSTNSVDRYLLNSEMLSQFKRDKSNGISFKIQHESPVNGVENNWLPSPNGPFFMVMRLYWPKIEALNGTWQQPTLKKIK